MELNRSILIVTRKLSEPQGDDIGKYAYRLLQALRAIGHNATVCMSTPDLFLRSTRYLDIEGLLETLWDTKTTAQPKKEIKLDDHLYDIIVVIGGDGTMVGVCRDISSSQIVVKPHTVLIGINGGRLGFITDFPISSQINQVINLIDGTPGKDFKDEKRSLLGFYGNKKEGYNLALNEVVLKSTNGRIIEFSVFFDDELAYKCRGDGVLVTTPTGSTAYNASAGGPFLYPTSRVFCVTPLLSQSLAYRSMVIPDGYKVKLEVHNGNASLYLDGIQVIDESSDTFTVEMVKEQVIFRHPINYSFFRTLREKLNWQLEPGTR